MHVRVPLICLLLTGCFLFDSTPTVVHEYPADYSRGWSVLLYSCSNGQPLVEMGSDKYLASYPMDGVLLTSSSAFPVTRIEHQRRNTDGTLSKLSSSSGSSGVKRSEFVEGQPAYECSYSYRTFNTQHAEASEEVTVHEALDAACARCTPSAS